MSAGVIAAHYAAAGGGGPSGYAAEVLADSPLAYWPLSETSGSTFADLSGNSKTLTAAGSPTVGATGPFVGEYAVTLNGSSQYLDSNQGINHSDFTIEFWWKGTDTAGKFASARSNTYSMTVGLGPMFGGVNGGIHWGVDAGGTWEGIVTNGAINDGTWKHVACVWDGTSGSAVAPAQLKIYVDGVQAATSAASYVSANAPITSSGVGYRFGAARDGSGDYVAGDFSNIAVYGSALSAARVAAHFGAA